MGVAHQEDSSSALRIDRESGRRQHRIKDKRKSSSNDKSKSEESNATASGVVRGRERDVGVGDLHAGAFRFSSVEATVPEVDLVGSPRPCDSSASTVNLFSFLPAGSAREPLGEGVQMNGYEAMSALGEQGTGKPTPIAFESLIGPLASVLDGLPVPFGFAILGLPSLALPETSPLDAPQGVVFPYSQIHRDANGAFVLEISSNFYLRPPHQLALDFEYALFEHGWDMPDLSVKGRENFRRVTTDGDSAARLVLAAAELFGAAPGQLALIDCAVACASGEPAPILPDTSILEELLDEARWQFLVSREPQGHVRDANMSAHGSPVLSRDQHAAHLITGGYGIILGGDQPGFEIEARRGRIGVVCGADFVELTIRFADPDDTQQREHLAAIFHALNDSNLRSKRGTNFCLDGGVVLRRNVRGLQPSELFSEVQDFEREAIEFEDRLRRMLETLN